MIIELVKKIEDYEVIQRKDGMVNATEFLKRYNETAKVKKRMDVFFRAAETKAFIDELKTDTNIEMVSELVKEKQEGYKPMRRTWWFCPSLFVDFAMWLDVRIKHTFSNELVKVIGEPSFWNIYARIMENLNIGGDADKCKKLVSAVNYVVFDKDEPDVWLKATYEQRCELRKILGDCEKESKDSMDYDTCINIMRKIYQNKHKNVI